MVQNTETELLQLIFFTYCADYLPQHDAFLIGFLNADNQAANKKVFFPHFFPPPFNFFSQGKAAAEL